MLKTKVIYEGRQYDKIKNTPEEFAKGVINLGFNDTNGGLFTTSVISKFDYRKKNPTKARLKYNCFGHYHVFRFYGDYGHITSTVIIYSNKEEVSEFVQKALRHANRLELIKEDEIIAGHI